MIKKIGLSICIGIFLLVGVACTSKTPNNNIPNKTEDKVEKPTTENKGNVELEKNSDLSREILTGSANIIKTYTDIKDAKVEVKDKTIIFHFIPASKEITQERVKELAEYFVKSLAGYTVNSGLKGPEGESYGEIYEKYDVEVIVEDENGTILNKGTKKIGENKIQWQE